MLHIACFAFVLDFIALYLASIEGFILCFPDLQGLCEWRDIVARAEDESTGYVLPNKSVLEIGMKRASSGYLNVNNLA